MKNKYLSSLQTNLFFKIKPLIKHILSEEISNLLRANDNDLNDISFSNLNVNITDTFLKELKTLLELHSTIITTKDLHVIIFNILKENGYKLTAEEFLNKIFKVYLHIKSIKSLIVRNFNEWEHITEGFELAKDNPLIIKNFDNISLEELSKNIDLNKIRPCVFRYNAYNYLPIICDGTFCTNNFISVCTLTQNYDSQKYVNILDYFKSSIKNRNSNINNTSFNNINNNTLYDPINSSNAVSNSIFQNINNEYLNETILSEVNNSLFNDNTNNGFNVHTNMNSTINNDNLTSNNSKKKLTAKEIAFNYICELQRYFFKNCIFSHNTNEVLNHDMNYKTSYCQNQECLLIHNNEGFNQIQKSIYCCNAHNESEFRYLYNINDGRIQKSLELLISADLVKKEYYYLSTNEKKINNGKNSNNRITNNTNCNSFKANVDLSLVTEDEFILLYKTKSCKKDCRNILCVNYHNIYERRRNVFVLNNEICDYALDENNEWCDYRNCPYSDNCPFYHTFNELVYDVRNYRKLYECQSSVQKDKDCLKKKVCYCYHS